MTFKRIIQHIKSFCNNICTKNTEIATPLFSIVVTSYNYEKFVTQTLSSLCKQTYRNFEVIVVDDGSKDNSINIIQQFTNKNDFISLYTHEGNANKGIIPSIQLAISKAKGDYIAFCESDDYWSYDHLELAKKQIRKGKDVCIISNNIQLFGDEECVNIRQGYIDHINRILKPGKNRIDISHNQKMNYIPTLSSVMIKREILLSLDFNTPIPAWIDFWLYRQILKVHPLYYIPQKTTFWRQHVSYNGNQVQDLFEDKIEQFIPESNRLIGIANEE